MVTRSWEALADNLVLVKVQGGAAQTVLLASHDDYIQSSGRVLGSAV